MNIAIDSTLRISGKDIVFLGTCIGTVKSLEIFVNNYTDVCHIFYTLNAESGGYSDIIMAKFISAQINPTEEGSAFNKQAYTLNGVAQVDINTSGSEL